MGIGPARSAPLEAIRWNPWALKSCQKVGFGSKLHTMSPLQLCVAALLLRLTLHWMGNTISKNLNHPSIHDCCQITRPLFRVNSMRKLCGIFVPIGSRRSAENSAWIKLIVPSAEARFDTWRHRRRKEKKSRQRRINVQSAFRVLSTGALSSGPEHAHLGVYCS